MKMKNSTNGISLIVLVITIIVVIIIAAAVILTLTSNNPISEARKATFLSDIDTFRNDLDMYNAAQYASTLGNYDLNSVNLSVSADENLLYSAIPSLKGKTKYYNSFSVVNGALAYTGTKDEEIDWAKNVAGILTTNAKPELAITTSNILPVKAGGSIVYTVAMTGTVPITTVNLSGNIKVLNNGGTELGTQPSISVGAVSGTTADKERSAIVTINTTGMAEGTYKIKVLAEAVQTAGSKSAEKISTATFEIDNTAPAMPTITINPTTWTSSDVTATLTKSNAADTLEYSTNGTTWNAYTTPLTITSNLTVYARETDSANNTSAQATQVITIIDKTVPVAATINVNASESLKVTGTVTMADAGSGINLSQSKYILTTQSTAYGVSDIAWNSATVMGSNPKVISIASTAGEFYLQTLSVDNAGNKIVNVSGKLIVKLGNAPVLAAGMTPIKWDASGNISTTTTSDAAWYNYSSKQWANAQTADGSMWVWIPRYEYQIPTTHSSTAQTINVNFISGTGTTATGGYTMHPAFTFGSTQVTGIWVAKFKASGSGTALRVSPGVSVQQVTINNAFTYCRNMETSYGAQYGWGTSGTGIDTHLMKNIEWGAAAYLAYSTYGKNAQVWNNPYPYITGYAYTSADVSNTSGYPYNNMTYGIQESTTGNCFGVYDMTGPQFEFVAAYVNNSYANSYGSTVYSAAAQYKDVYTVTSDDYTNNYNNAASKKGDAVYETSSNVNSNYGWNNDGSYMPYTSIPFFVRGGYYGWTSQSGLFSFYYSSTDSYAFRPVLLVDSTLT